jgi:putative ABC transport system substrate-binding protein
VTGAHLDPVGSGLVASLARPGGNVTGFATIIPDLRGKQLQLLKEAVPRLDSVAILSDPSVPAYALALQKLETAARAMKMTLYVVQVRAPAELADAVAAAARNRAGALLVLMPALFYPSRSLTELAIRNRLPLAAQATEFAEAGGLMTYGVDLRDTFRGAAGYVDRILKGAKPGDLPVAQPTTLYLAINLKTAKALSLTIPPSLLARADEVIE